jgi:hypothetical protein
VKGRSIPYSAAERAWLQENHLLPIAEYHAAFSDAFNRSDVSAANLHALRKRKGWRTGRTGCFTPGQVPLNKGKRCPEGTGGRHPNARRTQFRKGERSGVATRLYKPIGTERLYKGGYLQRKVNDDLPAQARWRFVHLIRWEEVNGPLPAGYALKCLDGNRQNTNPSNWEAVSRGVLARLNGGRFKKRIGFDQAHPDVKPVVMAIAKLEQRASERRGGAA